MNAITAYHGAQGFDCNSPIDATKAQAFRAAGYVFALRYIPRLIAKPTDITAAEVAILHAAGLAIMFVQHVESEKSWGPTQAKGSAYGAVAASHASLCGIAKSTTLWLDLEGVADGTPADDVIAYCNAWFDSVAASNFQPGLYVGWHAGLNSVQLHQLKFTRYWAAYNLNADQGPAVRGVCMRQHVAPNDPLFNVHGEIAQRDVIQQDALGDLPTVCAPDGWEEVA